MNRVLITGATGYIGSRLAKALLSSYEVYALSRQPLHLEYLSEIKDSIHFSFYDGSFASIDRAMQSIRPELVFHLATYYTASHDAAEVPKLLESNLQFGAYLLEAMAKNGCTKLLYTTSVMTDSTGEGYCPLNLYAATKKAFSDLLDFYVAEGLLEAITLILSDTYGLGDHRKKILNLIREASISGGHLALSSGTQDYDVVYIADVIRALTMAGERLLGGIQGQEKYQVFPETVETLRSVAERLIVLSGNKLEAGWGERAETGRSMRKAVRLAPPLPGWKAEVSLEEGLKKMIEETE